MNKRTRREFLWGGVQVASALAVGCGSASQANPPTEASGGASGSAGGSSGGAGTPGQAGAAGSSGAGGSGGTAACERTPADIEGPFFTPSSPEKTELREVGMAGQLLVVRGRVVGPDCNVITNAVLDFWQADDDGAYDNAGFRLRGHQRVDAEGRYEVRTIVPGHYLNGSQFRPAHVHVKVYVGDREALTTQLYFEGDPYNDIDPWFNEATMLRPVETGGEIVADYDFTVD